MMRTWRKVGRFAALAALTLGLAAGCGKKAEEAPAIPDQSEFEKARADLKEFDAKMFATYKKHSETFDPALRAEMEAQLADMEIERKRLNAEVLRLQRELREEVAPRP